MSEQLLKNYSIQLEQKLYEKETAQGHLAVYQTTPFGMMMTLDHHVIISETDGFLYHEMLAHPVLFTHHQPKKIALVGNCFGILEEVVKHPSVQEVVCIAENQALEEAVAHYFSENQQVKQDKRVSYHLAHPLQWLSECPPETFEVIIQTQITGHFLREHYEPYLHVLKPEGMLVQPCQSSLLELNALKPTMQTILDAGFYDGQMLNFPQPSYPSGWRTVMMAIKGNPFKRIREKDIFNRKFKTRYYNFDTHKAALSLPEFLRTEMDYV